MRLLEVREFAEDLEALVDLFAGERLQTLRAEALDGERSHDSAIEEGTLQDLTIQLFLRGQVAHEAASEGVSSAGGIFHFVDRERGCAERMTSDAECTLSEEDGRTVFTVLDDQGLRSHREDSLRSARQVGFVRQHLSLAVVDQKDID